MRGKNGRRHPLTCGTDEAFAEKGKDLTQLGEEKLHHDGSPSSSRAKEFASDSEGGPGKKGASWRLSGLGIPIAKLARKVASRWKKAA